MMDFVEFYNYLDKTYMIILLCGGYAFTSRTKGTKFEKHKEWAVFAIALILSVVFIAAKVYDGKDIEVAKYVITYVTTTSFYELLVKKLIRFMEKL